MHTLPSVTRDRVFRNVKHSKACDFETKHTSVSARHWNIPANVKDSNIGNIYKHLEKEEKSIKYHPAVDGCVVI
jgi:hypothetical protein